MGKVVLVLWIAAIAFGGFWFFYYQEGANRDIIIEFDGRGTAPGTPMEFQSGTIYMTNSRAAMVTKGQGRDTGKVIIDMKDKKLLVVADKQKVVMTMPFKLVDKSECEPAKAIIFTAGEEAKRLPDTKTIAGLRCHAFQAGRRLDAGTVWFTYEFPLGREHLSLVNRVFRIEMEGGPSGGGLMGMSRGKRPQLSGRYFPIPLLANVRSPRGNVHFEVKSIKHGKVDKSVFEVPSGYKEVDFSELLRGFRGRPERGGR